LWKPKSHERRIGSDRIRRDRRANGRRGRSGTETACSGHSARELFCLIDGGTLTRVEVPSWSVGSIVEASIGGRFKASILLDPSGFEEAVGAPHRVAAIKPPSGGSTIDGEARNSIDQILSALREQGLIEA